LEVSASEPEPNRLAPVVRALPAYSVQAHARCCCRRGRYARPPSGQRPPRPARVRTAAHRPARSAIPPARCSSRLADACVAVAMRDAGRGIRSTRSPIARLARHLDRCEGSQEPELLAFPRACPGCRCTYLAHDAAGYPALLCSTEVGHPVRLSCRSSYPASVRRPRLLLLKK